MMTHEDKKIIPLIAAADHQASGINSAGIYVAGAHHVTVIIQGGAQTDGDARVTTKYGTAHATMVGNLQPEVYSSAAAADAANADSLTAVSYETGEDYWKITDTNNLMYVLEIDVDEVPSGNSWIRVEVGDEGAGTFIAAVAIVYPRYKPSTTLVRTA